MVVLAVDGTGVKLATSGDVIAGLNLCLRRRAVVGVVVTMVAALGEERAVFLLVSR
jgi:hypothetical protein